MRGTTYSAVSTVCASPLLWRLVDLDVLDDQVGGVETLGVGVGLSVLEEGEQELGGLDWPAGLVGTELLGYRTKDSLISLFSLCMTPKDVRFQMYASTQLADSPCAVRPVLPA